jgi:hypothetical protein
MNHPDPKKHQLISFVKSGIRIAASVGASVAILYPASASIITMIALAILILALGYGLAEVVGVYEELV